MQENRSIELPKMPRNVEIKAKLVDFPAVLAKARVLSDKDGGLLEQKDTFFRVPNGRLKLRQFASSQPSELIFYERSDITGPKLSTFSTHKMACDQAPSLSALLSAAIGVRGVVSKRRHLLFIGQTRVHLDEVEGLGEFLELEVVLRDEQTLEEGQAIANRILPKLGVEESCLCAGAYIDMLEQKEL